MDKSVKPGEDFFRYANGHWLDTHQIPGDKPAVSLRLEMTDRTEARLHGMMEDAAKTTPHQPTDLSGKMGAFYKAFMDEKHIEDLGAKPIAPELNAVKAAKTRDDLAVLMGKTNADFEDGLYGFGIDIDLKNPKQYAVYLSQSGLGLPDRDYYLQASFAAPKAKYESYVAQLLTLIDWPDATNQAKAIVAFEARIADASWTKAQDRDLNAVYNPTTVSDLNRLAPGFNWNGFVTSAGLSKLDRVIVAEKSAFPKLAAI
jgi:putative endopeptidase